MARITGSLESVQSQSVVDVSQNAHSSPSTSHSELYAVSPETQARKQALRSSAKGPNQHSPAPAASGLAFHQKQTLESPNTGSTVSTKVVHDSLGEEKSAQPLTASCRDLSQLGRLSQAATSQSKLPPANDNIPTLALAGVTSSTERSMHSSVWLRDPSATSHTTFMAPTSNPVPRTSLDLLRAKREREGRTQPAPQSETIPIKLPAETQKSRRGRQQANESAESGKAASEKSSGAAVQAKADASKAQQVKKHTESSKPTAAKGGEAIHKEAELSEPVSEQTPSASAGQVRPGKLSSIKNRMRGGTQERPQPKSEPTKSKSKPVRKQRRDKSDDDYDDDPPRPTRRVRPRGVVNRQKRKRGTRQGIKENNANPNPTQRTGKKKAVATSQTQNTSPDLMEEQNNDEKEHSVQRPKRKPGALPRISKDTAKGLQQTPQPKPDRAQPEHGDDVAPFPTISAEQDKQASNSQAGGSLFTTRQPGDVNATTKISELKAAASKEEVLSRKALRAEPLPPQWIQQGRASSAQQKRTITKDYHEGLADEEEKEDAVARTPESPQPKPQSAKAWYRTNKEDDTEINKVTQKSDRVGTAQENPVELSNNANLSSFDGDLPSPPPASVTKEDARLATESRVQDPRTPSPMASSPPIPRQAQGASAMYKKVKLHKPQLVGFDENGPRNQGSISAHTPIVRSMKTDRAAVQVDELPRKIKMPSLNATSMRTSSPTNAGQTSNIASDVNDALATMCARKSTLAMFSKPFKPTIASPKTAQVEQVDDSERVVSPADDDSFFNVDGYDGDIPVSEAASAGQADVEPLLLVRKPTKTDITSQQTILPLDVLQERAKWMSGASSPPPPPPPPPNSNAAVNDAADRCALAPKASKPWNLEPSTNFARGAGDAGEVGDVVSTKDTALQTAAASRPKRANNTQTICPPAAKRMKFNEATMKHMIQQDAPTLAKASGKQRGSAREQLRHASPGSQTVDMNGSPVPHGVDIIGTKTVLETYSQHHKDVADQGTTKRVLRALEETPHHAYEDGFNDNFYNAPSFHQPEILSSTKNPLSTSPECDPAGITIRVVTEEQSKKLLLPNDTVSTLRDPFNDLTGSSQTQSQSSTASESMRAMNFQMRRQKARFSLRGVEHNSAKTTSGLPSSWKKRPREDSGATHALKAAKLSKSAKDVDDNISKLRKHAVIFRTRNKSIPDDPDMTLVDGEHAIDAEKSPKDEIEEPRENTPVELELLEAAFEPLTDDLLEWSKDMRPHQIDFARELIKVSRAVVEYAIEQERRFERILEESVRREGYVIKQDELARARCYDELLEKQRKAIRSSRREMKLLLKDADEMLGDWRARKEERTQVTAQQAITNRKLEDLLVKLL